jgi:hypothetical protein
VTTIRIAKRRRWVSVANDAVQDPRLSFRARGLLVYLLSKPDDWRASSASIARDGTEGRDAVRAAMNELLDIGYLRIERVKDERGRWATVIDVHEEPTGAWKSGAGESADVESPRPGSPAPDSQAVYKDLTTDDCKGEEETYVSPSPRSRAHGRTNVVWDALAEHFGEPTTAPEKRRRGLTTKELREAGADAESIAAAVKRHKRIWPKVSCTERSIVAHWTELTKVDPVDAERAAHHARMKRAREESK